MVPFVPISGVTMTECIEMARRLAAGWGVSWIFRFIFMKLRPSVRSVKIWKISVAASMKCLKRKLPPSLPASQILAHPADRRRRQLSGRVRHWWRSMFILLRMKWQSLRKLLRQCAIHPAGCIMSRRWVSWWKAGRRCR